MELNTRNLALVEAYNRGFRVSFCGNFLQTELDFLEQTSFRGGYPVFIIKYKKESIALPWHRLQAYQKYGEDLFIKGLEVRHLNAIKTDCNYDNILIGTHTENMRDKPSDVVLRCSLNATDKVRKYNATEVKKFHQNSSGYKETMKHFGISSKGTLHFILNDAKYS